MLIIYHLWLQQNQDEDAGTGNDQSVSEAVSDSGESDEEISLSEDELKRGMVENLHFVSCVL